MKALLLVSLFKVIYNFPIKLSDIDFALWTFTKEIKTDDEVMLLYTSHLISLGILRYEDPMIDKYDYEGESFVELQPNLKVHFTELGFHFVKQCRFKETTQRNNKK